MKQSPSEEGKEVYQRQKAEIKLTISQCLDDMMDSDIDLYEKILDTAGFAYAWNQLLLIARTQEYELNEKSDQEDLAKAWENGFKTRAEWIGLSTPKPKNPFTKN